MSVRAHHGLMLAAAGPTGTGTITVASHSNPVYGSATAQAITLPSHQAGDIIVAIAILSSAGSITSSAGWAHTNYLDWSAGSDDACVTWRVAASGSETLTITSSASSFKSVHCFVLRGTDTVAGANTTGANSTRDPPSVNMPGSGAANGIVIVVCGQQTQTGLTTGAPSGYTAATIPDGFDKGGSAYKLVTSITSEDPPIFGGSDASNNVAISVAVRAA